MRIDYFDMSDASRVSVAEQWASKVARAACDLLHEAMQAHPEASCYEMERSWSGNVLTVSVRAIK